MRSTTVLQPLTALQPCKRGKPTSSWMEPCWHLAEREMERSCQNNSRWVSVWLEGKSLDDVARVSGDLFSVERQSRSTSTSTWSMARKKNLWTRGRKLKFEENRGRKIKWMMNRKGSLLGTPWPKKGQLYIESYLWFQHRILRMFDADMTRNWAGRGDGWGVGTVG